MALETKCCIMCNAGTTVLVAVVVGWGRGWGGVVRLHGAQLALYPHGAQMCYRTIGRECASC